MYIVIKFDMKQVNINQLEVGNIFTFEFKVAGRRAYEVLEFDSKNDSFLIQSRNDLSKTRKIKRNSNKKVILLHNQAPGLNLNQIKSKL